MFGGGILMF